MVNKSNYTSNIINSVTGAGRRVPLPQHIILGRFISWMKSVEK